MGIFDLHLNGKRVSEDRFNPGWTDYARRVYYRAYDVTELVKKGANVLGAILADGWYSGYIGFAPAGFVWEQDCACVCCFKSHTKTGRWSLWGPMNIGERRLGRFSSRIFWGEKVTTQGWNWQGGICRNSMRANGQRWIWGLIWSRRFRGIRGPPVKTVAEFRARSVSEIALGVYVLDMGQNLAGVARLTVRGQAGQRIIMRFAERLNADGTLHTANLRTARATDSYVCRGGKWRRGGKEGGVETWEPRFTFHGFQFIEVSGLTEPPTPDTVVALVLSSDTPEVGSFECSDAMVNQLRSNIYWTQRANFIDIPTDCPQRDERLGWTGDAQVYLGAAVPQLRRADVFRQVACGLADSQREDGQFPMVAPLKIAGEDGGPAWADAGVICPWMIYEIYGNVQLLRRQYPSMKRFIEFCEKRSTEKGLPPEKYHCFGDWLSIEAQTPNDVIYTAYFARSALLCARAAEVLGERGCVAV